MLKDKEASWGTHPIGKLKVVLLHCPESQMRYMSECESAAEIH